MYCPKCGCNVPADAAICHSCGSELPKPEEIYQPLQPLGEDRVSDQTTTFRPVSQTPAAPAAEDAAPYIPPSQMPKPEPPVAPIGEPPKPEPPVVPIPVAPKPRTEPRPAASRPAPRAAAPERKRPASAIAEAEEARKAKLLNMGLIAAMAVVGVLLLAVLVVLLLQKDDPEPGVITEPTVVTTEATTAATTEETTEATTGSTDPADALTADNPYAQFFTPDSFVLPESDSRYYSRGDMILLSKAQRVLAEAEIAARHGATFQDPHLDAYFRATDWYTPGSYSESVLNEFERMNLFLMDAYAREQEGSLNPAVNTYLQYAMGDDRYLFADSDRKYLNGRDLKEMTDQQLAIAAGEIYARRGSLFENDTALQEYFYTKQWYMPSVSQASFPTGDLNQYEAGNLDIIRAHQRIRRGIPVSAENPFVPLYNRYAEYILEDSDYMTLSERDLVELSYEQLVLARNEIFARRGYLFEDEELLAYFGLCSWYSPSTPSGKKELLEFTDVEKDNIELLTKIEARVKDIPDLEKLDTAITHKVETDHYSLKVPVYWKDCMKTESSNEGKTFVFYEKFSAQEKAGKLFSIHLMEAGEDYTRFPSYRFLGSITDSEGSGWNVVVLYPTDVQHITGTADIYERMSYDISAILNTFQADEDYAFSQFPLS